MYHPHYRHAYPLIISSLLTVSNEVGAANNDVPMAGETSLPSLVVTATKLEKNPIDVPFAITVFNSEELENKKIDDVYDVLAKTQNVEFSSSGDGRANSIYMRGVGPMVSPSNVEDTTVVVYIDGIPQPLTAIGNGYVDMERIEILKGPQGTLFGRNTTGGAINMITPTPTADSVASIRVSGGENGYYSIATVASGELSPGKVFGRIAINTQNEDAYIKNDIGSDVGENRKETLRGTLFFTPSDYTDIKVTLSAEEDSRNFSVFGLRPENGQDFATSLDRSNDVNKKAYGMGITLNHDADSFRFVSATGFNDIDSYLLTDDSDGIFFSANFGDTSSTRNNSSVDFSDWNERHQVFSQEFRLSSVETADIEWVSGVSFYEGDFDLLYKSNQAGGAIVGTRDGVQATTSHSVFGEVTLPVGEALDVVLGVRSTHEKKDESLSYTGNGAFGTVTSANRMQSLEDNFVTGRASVIYKLNTTSRVFSTVSSGHKTGGFQRYSNNIANGSAVDESFKGSDIMAYEVGYKHRANNVLFSFDVSAFYNELDDEQVLNATFTGGETLNVDARTYGFEMQSTYRLSNVWKVSTNLGYTVAEMKNVSDDFESKLGGKDGNKLPSIPKWSGGLNINYINEITNKNEFFADFSWQHTGERVGNIANTFNLKSFNDINLSSGVILDKKIKVYAFVRNLLDKSKEQFGFDFNNTGDNIGVALGRGRVVGLGLKASF
jgi:iron complex outermembrane receptor protein